MTVLATCTSQSRHRWLSFFFDGVPDPNAEARDPDAPEPARGPDGYAPGPLTLAQRAEIQSQRLPAATFSFHEPYRTKQCNACHRVQINDTGSWMRGVPELVAPKEQLCQQCHGPPATEHVHGPVATSSCYLCHWHHSSPHEHLLKAADTNSLCTGCHSGETFVTEVAHASFEEDRCTACHDPHGSDEKHLMRGAQPAYGARDERDD